MLGMEMMLANMVGLKPDEMRAIFTGLVNDANDVVKRVKQIEANQAEILSLLKGKDNATQSEGALLVLDNGASPAPQK